MNKLVNLEEVVQRLKTFLPQYLSEKGFDTTKNFSCINPKHEDSSPSMTIKQNNENAFCYGCNCTADIFQAAFWLEDKAISGPAFIEENVKYLAEKYGVELQLEEMSEEDLYRVRTYRAYKDAANLILNPSFGNYEKLDEEISRRRWDPDFAKTKIGTVNSKAFRDAMKALGYEAKFLDDIDLNRNDIFDENNMIFIISDEIGRPVGFAARNLIYDGTTGAKYMNQRTTGVRCNIYQKSRRLYELHIAMRHTPPLYVFEGYADVITAQNAGLKNCCAIGGTAFTQQHLDALKQLGLYSLILALDGDKAGKEKMRDLLDTTLANQRDMKIELVNLPEEMDPDDFIREKGVTEFLALRKWSAFEWRLSLYSDEDFLNRSEEICKTMIPLIVNEQSFIVQDKMCNELSKLTGIDKKILAAELDRLQNEREHQKTVEKERAVEQIYNEIRRNPDEAKSLLYECASKIEEIEEKYDENSFSIQSTIEFISGEQTNQEAASGEFAGFILSQMGLGELGEYLNGNWRSNVFMCLGGSANAGKSSLVSQMAFEIANNPANDAMVIYHTIDDSKEQILPRFVCQAYGQTDLTMNQVRNPNYYTKYEPEHGELIAQRRKVGYQNLMNLVNAGRIIIKDTTDGGTLAFGESLIRYYRNKFPERALVYILDNLHNTPDFAHLDERIKFKRISNRMKDLCNKYQCCMLSTVEYTKLPAGTVPTNNNIAETRALIFNSNFIGHLYNDLHELGTSAICVREQDGDLQPRIALMIGKNKITEYKGRVYLDFYPASALFRRVPAKLAEDEMRARMKMLRGNKSQGPSMYTNNYESSEEDE